MMKGKLNKTMRDEKGQALIIALVIMLVGSIIVTPLLAYMGSGLKTGKEVYEEKMYGQYAADAGVQDALYKITMDDPSFPGAWDGTWDLDAFTTPYSYSLPQLNGNNVSVTIQPYWLLTGLEDLFWGETPHSELLVVGDSTGIDPDTGNGIYKISITFDESQRTVMIDTIGAWLPPGYEYVDGSGNLGFEPSIIDFRGGTALRWVFGVPPTKFEDLDLLDGEEDGTATVTFQFTPQANLTSAFSWVMAQPNDIYLSYDANIKIFQIESEATDEITEKTITVSAYATQSEPRVVGTGVAGDYAAVGNGLLPYTTNPTYRDQLLIGSEAEVDSGDIPATATVQAAYLYWSGWIDYHYAEWKEGGGGGRPPGGDRWQWGEISELEYPSNPTEANLTELVEENAMVNVVSFGVGTSMTDITADTWEVMESTGSDYEGTWIYACLYDATDLVKDLIDDYKLGSNGTGTYKLEHASTVVNQLKDYGSPTGEYDTYCFDLFDQDGDPTGDYTGYPLGTPANMLPSPNNDPPGYRTRYNYSHAGWSLIIIYTSPETKGHQLYLYDIANPDFTFTEGWAPGGVPCPDFDGDGSPGGKISGFLVPPMLEDDDYSDDAARITCFVGEGDEGITGDYIRITGENGNSDELWDGITCSQNSETNPNNVWNSQSQGLDVVGIDVDTFHITWGDGIMVTGDTWAEVYPTTGNDGFTLVYIILSFRSEITPGGAVSYVYVGG